MSDILSKGKQNYRIILGALVVLLICVGIFVYYGQQKEIMFCDEVYSYTQINVHGVHIAVRDGKWYTAPEMDKRFSSIEGYNFKDVIEGTGWDVHPPIYYLILKAVAATFPASTSKWIGIGTNLLFFIPFLILLYWMIWRIIKKPWLAAALTVLLGVNQGMQGTALLIRMYMLFALWMLLFFMETEKLNERPDKKRFYAGLGVITFSGFMSHYYFAMYAALYSLFFVIDKAVQKKWKRLFGYLGAMVGVVAAATLVYPQWITHLFFSEKGTVSIDALHDWSNIGAEVIGALNDAGSFIFPGYGIVFWILLIIICICFYRIRGEELVSVKKHCTLHLLAQMLYYCIVAHMMPSPEPRYYWAVVILQCVTALYMLAYILKYYKLPDNKKIAAGILAVTAVYAALFPVRIKQVPYIGVEYKEGRLIMEQYARTPWIVYGEKDWVLHCAAFDFLIPEQLMFVTDASSLVYDEVLQNSGEAVLYVRSEEHLRNAVEKLEELSGCTCSYTLLAERPYNDAYLLQLEN